MTNLRSAQIQSAAADQMFASIQRLEVYPRTAFSFTNAANYGDIDINSTTFGRLTSVNVGFRVVQRSIPGLLSLMASARPRTDFGKPIAPIPA